MPRTLKARSRATDTTLQRHVSFFDDDGDRGVDVAECTRGLKALGLPVGVAEAAALAIVAALSLQTRGSLLAMNVDIENDPEGQARRRYRHPGQAGPVHRQALRQGLRRAFHGGPQWRQGVHRDRTHADDQREP